MPLNDSVVGLPPLIWCWARRVSNSIFLFFVGKQVDSIWICMCIIFKTIFRPFAVPGKCRPGRPPSLLATLLLVCEPENPTRTFSISLFHFRSSWVLSLITLHKNTKKVVRHLLDFLSYKHINKNCLNTASSKHWRKVKLADIRQLHDFISSLYLTLFTVSGRKNKI